MMDGMAKYDSYKDSGVPWLGQVPESWEVKPLVGLFNVSRERNGKSIVGSMLSVSGYRGIEVKKYESESQVRDDKDLADYRVVRPKQLVVNTMWLNHTGLGVSEIEGHVSPAYRAYDIHPSLLPRYAHHLLRCHNYVEGYTGLMQGIRPNSLQIKDVDFKRMPVLVPDLATQNRIVDFLDEKTAEIDAAIAKKRRLIDLLHEQKAILINRAVTKGLNPDAPMKDSGVDWIGEIPTHWDVKRLKYLVRNGTTISYGIVQPGDHFEGGIPFVQTTNISKERIDIGDLQCTNPKIALAYPRTKLEISDLILGIRASVGAVHIVEQDLVGVNLSRGIARIAVNNSATAPFLKSFIQSQATEEFWTVASQGTTFTEISIANVKRLPVLVPTLPEQKEIAESVEQTSAEIFSAISHVEEEIFTLNEFKQTLIANAVTGKIKI